MDMLFDCAIIGGGPASLNAALILGRVRRNVMLFDNNNPRNAVTQKSHGFITRDGIKPNSLGGIAIDSYGRTNIQGVYATGDASVIAPAQIIIAAAEGSEQRQV